MIYVTGDTHGIQDRFTVAPEEKAWKVGDIIIVCGDFGYLFQDNEQEHDFLDKLEQKPYTICFVDGNHENFHAIFGYPEEEWNGGRVHRIRKNVLHLMRGQVFVIEGKKIFTMGGAYSVDEATKRLEGAHWEEEVPTWPECQGALDVLARHENRVDYILTHTAPSEIIRRMGYTPNPTHPDSEFTGFLEYLMYEIEFGHWYFGHWHLDKDITDKITALWFDVKCLE